MSTNFRLRPSAQAQADLQHLSSLLHLFHHRNHNQHRRSAWFRHFSIFRKQLNKLLEDYTELARVPDTHLGKHRKKAQDQQTTIRIQQRLEFWRDVLVPKTGHAFSQVTADGRFAVLGVVLHAILAQVCNIVGIVTEYEEMGQLEVEKVLQQFANEEWGDMDTEKADVAAGEGAEDFGEVLIRGSPSDQAASSTPPVPSLKHEGATIAITPTVETSTATARIASKQKKDSKSRKRTLESTETGPKKKQKRDAIDDLFSGL